MLAQKDSGAQGGAGKGHVKPKIICEHFADLLF